MSTVYFQIEVEATNPKSGDLFEVGRYETLEEANAYMPDAIDGLQRELDLRIYSPKKEVMVYLNKETLDDDGDWISSEGIAAAKVVFRKKTLWNADKMDYEIVDAD